MSDQDDSTEHAMRTRKKRRNYKSLEDGKDEVPVVNTNTNVQIKTKPARTSEDNFISKPGNNLNIHKKDIKKPFKSINTELSDGSRTSGRWTSEEHKKFVEALKLYGKQWKKVEEYI